jgi:hypothetical protein
LECGEQYFEEYGMKKDAQNNKKPNVVNPDDEYFDEDEIANSEIEEGRIPT